MPTWGETLAHLGLRKKSYQAMFGKEGVLGTEAMLDLAKFCRVSQAIGVPGSPDLTWAQIGRREVWLRICEHLRLEPEELATLYGAVVIDRTGEDNG